MQVTRREFLKLGGAAAAVSAAPALVKAARPRPDIVWAAQTPDQMPEPDLAALLLSRAAFGARPGDVERIRGHEPEWIEEQLDFASIDNSAVVAQVENGLPTLRMTPEQLLELDQAGQTIQELQAATLYYMIFSPRLVHETLVEFWSDHFSVYHQQDQVQYFKTIDDRDVIRPHAMSSFKQLLTASAHSPAMLNFLNNDDSTKVRPNENYGREIMELHSLGVAVDGYPYTEEDVKEVARCLTGWAWDTRRGNQRWGLFEFRDGDHDNGSKTVLGHFIPASQGVQDGFDVLDILSTHEATPKFIGMKLIRRFVTDHPTTETPELLDKVAQTYVLSGGDIVQMMRTILQSQEFANSFAGYGGRLSRPMDLVARSLRALDLQPSDVTSNIRAGLRNIIGNGILNQMGQVPFNWPTPDGFPDVKENWTASATMLARWNTGLAAAGAMDNAQEYLVPGFNPRSQTPSDMNKAGQIVDFWIDRLLHRPMLDADRSQVIDYLTLGGTEGDTVQPTDRRVGEVIALILDSPYFQWR